MDLTAHAPVADLRGWQAELELTFARQNQKTLLVKRKQSGPLTVQRPFYPEGNVPHIYLLHPPGGVVAGDELSITLHVTQAAHALVTTPAANKFYRSAGAKAIQKVLLRIEKSGALEWLPQETILYEGTELASSIQLELAHDSRFVGWEILALGRPAAGEGFESGHVDLRWHITLEQQPLLLERLRLDSEAFKARWGLQGASAMGSMLLFPATVDHLAQVRQFMGTTPDFGVTRIDNLLICRMKDDRSDKIRSYFEQIWRQLRPSCLGCSPCPPRIWAT